jgi:hypothetical protein
MEGRPCDPSTVSWIREEEEMEEEEGVRNGGGGRVRMVQATRDNSRGVVIVSCGAVN